MTPHFWIRHDAPQDEWQQLYRDVEAAMMEEPTVTERVAETARTWAEWYAAVERQR